jgi:hypothetical protein
MAGSFFHGLKTPKLVGVWRLFFLMSDGVPELRNGIKFFT